MKKKLEQILLGKSRFKTSWSRFDYLEKSFFLNISCIC